MPSKPPPLSTGALQATSPLPRLGRMRYRHQNKLWNLSAYCFITRINVWCTSSPPPPLPRCSSDIVTGVEHLLQHVSSIKALASIKSAVHSLLSASPEPAPEGDSAGHSTHNTGDHTQWEERWVKVCTLILNKELNIWPSFFGPTLLKRVQVIVQ